MSGREVNLDKRALFLGQPSKQRIFISYRRDDAQWAAGRLADALSAYFGDQRVFRDIDGIAGGADFGDVIQENLGTADAVIVLIGPDWLDAADSQGRQRLQNPTDWVVREVATALEKGVPVYPVLVDGAAMPRSDELPEALKPLVRFNALSISDDRWQADVSRLARIVALDIPSETGRHLQRINLLISTALLLALVFTVSVVVSNLLLKSSRVAADVTSAQPNGKQAWRFTQLFDSVKTEDPRQNTGGEAWDSSRPGDCTNPPESWLVPLSTM